MGGRAAKKAFPIKSSQMERRTILCVTKGKDQFEGPKNSSKGAKLDKFTILELDSVKYSLRHYFHLSIFR